MEEDLSSARSLQFMRAPVVKVGFNTNEVFSDAEGCSMNNYDSVSTTHWQYQKPSDDYFNETLDDHDVKHRLIL